MGRKIKLKFLLIIIVLLITSCSSIRKIEQNVELSENFVNVEKGIIFFRGEITSKNNQIIFESFDHAEMKPTLLSIHSGGGEIGAGIELGKWVFENSLNVIVDRVCASSCANYVFPAANIKFLKKNSIVVWHGGAHQESFDKYINDKYMIQLRNKERAFYEKIKVHCSLPTYGIKFVKPYHLWYISIFNKVMLGYDYSLADLNKFGVKNVSLIDNEWDWRKHSNPNIYALSIAVHELENVECS